MEVFNVYWTNYNERYRYTIGTLIYDTDWYFRYQSGVREAIELGFRPFPDMSDLDKTYKNSELFSVFKMRYPQNNNIIQVMKDDFGSLVTDKILIKYIKKQVDTNE